MAWLVLLLIALNIKYKKQSIDSSMNNEQCIYPLKCMQGICLTLNVRALLYVHCIHLKAFRISNYDWVYYSYNWVISIVLLCAFFPSVYWTMFMRQIDWWILLLLDFMCFWMYGVHWWECIQVNMIKNVIKHIF